MSITFVTTRELSKRPGSVLQRVRKNGPQVVTKNGRPAAYIIPASRAGIEADIEAIRILLFRQAAEMLQDQAETTGASELTEADIDAEIKTVRAARRRRA